MTITFSGVVEIEIIDPKNLCAVPLNKPNFNKTAPPPGTIRTIPTVPPAGPAPTPGPAIAVPAKPAHWDSTYGTRAVASPNEHWGIMGDAFKKAVSDSNNEKWEKNWQSRCY